MDRIRDKTGKATKTNDLVGAKRLELPTLISPTGDFNMK
jgi:hypothetical protein